MRQLALLLTIAAALSAAKRPITENDLYAFKWVADPQISPDGSQVVYTLATVTDKHDNYATALWMVPATGGAPRQITAGPRDASPRWSPDGATLAFTRAAETTPQIYMLNMHGGEPRALTSLSKGAANPVWSPDGHTIAFLSASDSADDPKKKDEEKSDVRIINRAVYRSNGAGYVDYTRISHIWSVAVPDILSTPPKPKQITNDHYNEGGLLWSRDGRELYFSADRKAESYYDTPHSDIYSVPAAGGEMRKLVSVDGGTRAMSLSPDGKHMAFIGALNGEPIKSYSQPDLWVTALEPGSKPQNLTSDYDFDIGGGIGGDQGPPRGAGPSVPFWSKDGRSILCKLRREGPRQSQESRHAFGQGGVTHQRRLGCL